MRRIRLEVGMTQEEVSHESGVTQSHISEIESGRRNSSVDLVGTIARVLGVPIAKLFEQREETSAEKR